MQLLAEGRHAEAEAAFRRAGQLAPDLPEVSFNIAKALQAQERFREAEEHLPCAVQQRPQWVEAHFQLGSLYHSLRRLTEAEAAYRRILELQPDHIDSLNSLGANIFNNEGRIDEARAVYRQALAIEPAHVNCHSNLVFNEQYAPGVTLAGLAEVHAIWERQHAAPLRRPGGLSPRRAISTALFVSVSYPATSSIILSASFWRPCWSDSTRNSGSRSVMPISRRRMNSRAD